MNVLIKRAAAEVRVAINDTMDKYCKPCSKLTGVTDLTKRLEICAACKVGQHLQYLGSILEGKEDMPQEKMTCTKENYLKMQAEGKKNAEIAKIFGKKDATLYYHLDKWGVREKKQSVPKAAAVVQIKQKPQNLNPAIWVLEKELESKKQLAEQYLQEAQSIESAIKHLQGITTGTEEAV